MGMIRIVTEGSFTHREWVFSASEHGHAHAVAEAIEYLSKKLLPWSINKDHSLHEAGEKPALGWEMAERLKEQP